MTSGFTTLPLKRTALWAFVLNTIWEFVQCTLFYDMGGWPFWRTTVWMWASVLGDVAIVLGLVLLSVLVIGAPHFDPPDRKGTVILLSIGFVSSILLEWAAKALHLWSYNSRMPTLEISGYEVGLSPILQITLLPMLSLYLATRRNLAHPASGPAASSSSRAGRR